MKRFYSFSVLAYSVLSNIWADLIFKIAGNLFPLYIGAFILLLVDSQSVSNVFDPQSLIIYSSTFLFSSIYLWYQTLDTKDNGGIFVLLFLLLLAVCISLLYAFSFSKLLDENFNFVWWSFGIFFLSIIIFIIYESRDYYLKNKGSFGEESKQTYDDFAASFNEVKDE